VISPSRVFNIIPLLLISERTSRNTKSATGPAGGAAIEGRRRWISVTVSDPDPNGESIVL
jgi:hypothetical protein